MKWSPAAFIGGALVYLLLTLGSGDEALLWSYWELGAAVIAGVLTCIIVSVTVPGSDRRSMANPLRWVYFVIYLFPFFLAMTRANIDVACRVITGRIRPGIVRIRSGLETKMGLTILANSITLTPGTLTTDVDEKGNDLYVHWINVSDSALEESKRTGRCGAGEVAGSFPDWARRIAE